MIVSIENKYIFIQVPKTATRSISKMLYEVDETVFLSVRSHAKACEVEERFKDFFKFCFFRNPWERSLSLFFYHINNDNIEEVGQEQKRILNEVRFILKNNLYKKDIFYDFLINYFPKNYISQFNWCYDEHRNNGIDFIGDFSNLDKHWEKLCSLINIEYRELDKINATKHNCYSEYYNSKSYHYVFENSKKDIKYFDYKFGNRNQIIVKQNMKRTPIKSVEEKMYNIKDIYENSDIYKEASSERRDYIKFSYNRFSFIIEQIKKSGIKFTSPVLDVASGECVFYPIVNKYLTNLLPYYATNYDHYKSLNVDGDEIPVSHFLCEEGTIEHTDDFFSTIFFFDVIEHLIKDPIKPFVEMNRVLRKNGYLIISTPNASSFFKIFSIMRGEASASSNSITKNINDRHNREFTVDEICKISKITGFEVVYYNTGEDNSVFEIYEKIKPLIFKPKEFRNLGEYLFVILQKKKNIEILPYETRYPKWLYSEYNKWGEK